MAHVSYYTGGLLPAAPAQNKAEQWDDVSQTYTAWDKDGNVLSTRAYMAAEITQAQADATTAIAQTNAATLQQRALNALAANTTYLGIASPTNAQVVSQVQQLTRECSALIRLMLNQLDSTN